MIAKLNKQRPKGQKLESQITYGKRRERDSWSHAGCPP